MNVQRYLGEIRGWANEFRVPTGWALCDGQSLPIRGNEDLFVLIGKNYGGDGKSNFRLPDLCGRMPLGIGVSKDGIAYQAGLTGGVEAVTLTSQQIPKHTHNSRCSSAEGNSDSPANNYWAKGTALQYKDQTTVPDLSMNANAIGSQGKGLSHDNMPPYFALNFIICLDGEKPVLPT